MVRPEEAFFTFAAGGVSRSLSEEEYRDPVRVFRKAFKEYGLEEFEEFLSDVVYFSLGTFNNVPERDIVGPYLHLIKMLDGAWLILERKKIKCPFSKVWQPGKAHGLKKV